jgi:hypothetical protein
MAYFDDLSTSLSELGGSISAGVSEAIDFTFELSDEFVTEVIDWGTAAINGIGDLASGLFDGTEAEFQVDSDARDMALEDYFVGDIPAVAEGIPSSGSTPGYLDAAKDAMRTGSILDGDGIDSSAQYDLMGAIDPGQMIQPDIRRTADPLSMIQDESASSKKKDGYLSGLANKEFLQGAVLAGGKGIYQDYLRRKEADDLRDLQRDKYKQAAKFRGAYHVARPGGNPMRSRG